MSAPYNASPIPFDFSTRLGIVFIVESASISAITVIGLLLYITVCALLSHTFQWILNVLPRSPLRQYKAVVSRKWPMETHTHYYFLNLLVSDLVQAIGKSSRNMFFH